MRITMNMIAKQYGKNLNRTLGELNAASNRSTTFRKFDKASEDPFSAAKAYRLRREYQQNLDYQSTLSDVESQLLTAQGSMISLNSLMQEAGSGDCVQAINATVSAEDRAIIANKLRTLQAAVLSNVNAKFADKYLFGGADCGEPPFTLGAAGNLLYKGVDVTTGAVEAGTVADFNYARIQFGKETGAFFNGYTVEIAAGAAGDPDTVTLAGTVLTVTMDLSAGKTNADVVTALKNTTGLVDGGGNPLDFSYVGMTGDASQPVSAGMASTAAYDTVGAAGLEALADEKAYVDLGMGLAFNPDGSVKRQSVFNTAIPGLSFLGYGSSDGTASGVSHNIYLLLGQLADQLEDPGFSIDNIRPYLEEFSAQEQKLLTEITNSGTNSNYLDSLKTRLETTGDSIGEKIVNVEYLDSATAIMDYKMQTYAYQAALQMGTQILRPSILDFMD